MSYKLKGIKNLWKPLTILLLLPLAFINVGFASPGPTYTVVPTDSLGAVDATFSVEVYGYDLVNIYAWQVYMEWDKAVLDATEIVIAGWLGVIQSQRINNDVEPSFLFCGESLTGVVPGKDADAVLLCTITFLVQEETPTTLDISGGEIQLTYYQHVGGGAKYFPITENGYYIGGPWDEDINADGWVDIFDLSSVAIHYLETGEPGWIPEDMSGPSGEPDGVVDIWDLTRVCLKYGQYAGY